MSTSPTERLHALDAVRAFALLLGIVLHATMAYWPGDIPLWIVMDPYRSEALFGTFTVIHIFRMALFFMLAGFFGRMLYHRLGAGRFIAHRLRRIALPLVAFWPISITLIVCVMTWSAAQTYGWPLPEDLPEPPRPDVPLWFPLTHLWFLYVLLWLIVGMLVLRTPVALIDRGGALRRVADKAVAALTRYHLMPVLLAGVTAAILLQQDYWVGWSGVPTPDQSLVPYATSLGVYGLAFAFGWGMHRQIALLTVWRNRWPLNLGLAVALTGYLLWQRGLMPNMMPLGTGTDGLLYAGAYALALWSWVFGLTGLAMQVLDRAVPAVRYLADASYWMYLMHLPLVMAMQVLLVPYELPAIAKFAIVLVSVTAVLLVSYQLMVRGSFIGWFLNRRRYGRKKAEPGPVPAAHPAE